MDLDQGGTSQQWEKVFLGPSLGWWYRPVRNILNITLAGTYNIDLAINLVQVNVAGAVILNLPAFTPPASQGANPGFLVRPTIVITDIGGFAQAHPITINAPAGRTIMSLSSIPLASNFGAYNLAQLDNGNYGNITS